MYLDIHLYFQIIYILSFDLIFVGLTTETTTGKINQKLLQQNAKKLKMKINCRFPCPFPPLIYSSNEPSEKCQRR